MYNGLMIEYRIGIPLLGKQPWLSEIKHVRDHHSFVDEQRIGPYRLWYHEHHFAAVDGGTQITDQVTYVMPFGFLGDIVHAVWVKNRLKGIFDFRTVKVKKLFG